MRHLGGCARADSKWPFDGIFCHIPGTDSRRVYHLSEFGCVGSVWLAGGMLAGKMDTRTAFRWHVSGGAASSATVGGIVCRTLRQGTRKDANRCGCAHAEAMYSSV